MTSRTLALTAALLTGLALGIGAFTWDVGCGTCQTCHHSSQEELRENVHTIQDRTYELRNIAIEAVLQLTRAIGPQKADSLNPRVRRAQGSQRKAQFMTGFIEAENSMGFHADQESARILANAINYARLGQAALRGEVLANIPRPALLPQSVSPNKASKHSNSLLG